MIFSVKMMQYGITQRRRNLSGAMKYFVIFLKSFIADRMTNMQLAESSINCKSLKQKTPL